MPKTTDDRLTNDKKIEILNDHYKESVAQSTEFRKLRDRLFALVLLTVTLLLFQLYAPNEAGTTIGEFITKKLEIQSAINIAFIQSAIWFVLLGLILRYFQTQVVMERQYPYIHDLEEQLGKYFEGKAFTREGKSYLENYPLFSDWVHFLYTIAFPSLLMIVVLVKIINEIRFSAGIHAALIFNIAIALCIVISIVLYIRMMYFHK